MDVDYFCLRQGLGAEAAVVAETEELDVLAWIVCVAEEALPEGVVPSADCVVLPLHLFT